MGTPSILISGASVAGPACASWLAAAGWDVTVVERFDHLRDEGHNVDVRGLGREVLRRMGLEDAVRRLHTTETGTDCVDVDGRAYASFPAGTDDTSGLTGELEILRGQLARLLHDHSSGTVAYRFGDHVTSLHDDGHGVDVGFARGPGRRFDAVVVAEGARSRTRDLAVPGARIDELGLLGAFATIPRTDTDDRRWRVLFGGRGRLVHLRPDDVGTTRAMLTMRTDARGLDRLDHDAVVGVLRATYGDLGWETPRILAALDDAPLYVDQIAQVRLPTWRRGRVVLLGDAAWCAGPFGTGTTSALTGAYVLAGELGSTPDDVEGAFARYERIVRPLVDECQRFVPPSFAHPRGPVELALLRTGLRVATGPAGALLRRIPGLEGTLPVDTITLPDYATPAPVAA